VRALLDLMRENEARLQNVPAVSIILLERESVCLNILDPLVGEEELIKAVAAELVRLRALLRSV